MQFSTLSISLCFLLCPLLLNCQQCIPQNCNSGCCKSQYTCLILTSSDKSGLQSCYSGDCSRIKCGSSMYCSNGRCFNNGDCSTTDCNTTTSAAVIVIAIVVPIGVCILITFICICWLRRRKYYQNNQREVAMQYRANVSHQNQAVIMQNQAANGQNPQTNYYPQGMINQQGNYQQGMYQQGINQQEMVQKGIPINSVVIPNGQPYFPHDAAKQEDYAIHQSHMGGEASGYNNRVYGQPPPQNFSQVPQGYNVGQPYMAGYQYPTNNYNNNNNNLWTWGEVNFLELKKEIYWENLRKKNF